MDRRGGGQQGLGVLAARAPDLRRKPAGVTEEQRSLAYEELLIAEGSDWNWWYGPEHSSANRAEFDALYRNHLANVYRALNLPPPEELSRPILKVAVADFRVDPVAVSVPSSTEKSLPTSSGWGRVSTVKTGDPAPCMATGR